MDSSTTEIAIESSNTTQSSHELGASWNRQTAVLEMNPNRTDSMKPDQARQTQV